MENIEAKQPPTPVEELVLHREQEVRVRQTGHKDKCAGSGATAEDLNKKHYAVDHEANKSF